MEVKIKVYTNTGFFNLLERRVPANEYRIYDRNQMKSIFGNSYNEHGQFDNVKHVIICKSWPPQKSIGGMFPDGKVFDNIVLRDDIHASNNRLHFNKDGYRLFKDVNGNLYKHQFPNENDHYVDMQNYGTSLAAMKSTYNLPDNWSGRINDLFNNGFQYDDGLGC